MASDRDWALLESEIEAINRFPGENPNPVLRMTEDGRLTGVLGRLQVTPETHARLQDRFAFERRGPVEIKGKGVIETWFLLGRRPA